MRFDSSLTNRATLAIGELLAVGISIRNKRKIPGVLYCINVREALQFIRQKTGLA